MFGMWSTMKGLIAMMLGGLGSVRGAVLGGLLLGGEATMRHLVPSALLIALAGAAAAQPARPRVDIGCEPTEVSLTYLCTLTITDGSGKPIDGAQVTLSADMPAMPMAHNVAPVKAQPVPGQAGSYQGRLVLEMTGEWVVRLRFDTPRPDVVVRKLDFQKDKVLPVGPR